MIRTLIIPDIHQRHELVEPLIARAQPDLTIFLGDYFDSHLPEHTGPVKARATAEWLAWSLKQEGRIHLLGNHDLSYRWPWLYSCSGFDPASLTAINDNLSPADWEKMKLVHYDGDWLYSHAGVNPGWLPKGFSENALDELCREALLTSARGEAHPFLCAGVARGGGQPYGGVTWQDFNREFQPIPGLHQMFGHTPGDKLRTKEDFNFSTGTESINLCVDCCQRIALVIKGGFIKEMLDMEAVVEQST